MKTIISNNLYWIANVCSHLYEELIKEIKVRYPNAKIEEGKNDVVKICLNSTKVRQAFDDVIEREIGKL